MSEMTKAMEEEVNEAIATLNRANDLLMNLFNTKEAQEELAECTRCWRDVPENELVTYGDWRLCDTCQDDI